LYKTRKKNRTLNILAIRLYEFLNKYPVESTIALEKVHDSEIFRLKNIFYYLLKRTDIKKYSTVKTNKIFGLELTKKNFFFYVNTSRLFLFRFLYNIKSYKNYLSRLNTFLHVVSTENKNEVEANNILFKRKMDTLEYLDNQATLMHGYKFHFVGRFTRKQQSANL
jgi:hypothetical protein